MQRFLTFLTLLVFSMGISYAQSCMLVEVPLQERVQNSALIVEGEVVRSMPFSNAAGTLINTAHEVRLLALRKGQVGSANSIWVVTQGGQLGQQLQVVEPSLTLKVGDKGLFTLATAQYEGQPTQHAVYQPVAGPQGFIRFLPDGTSQDVFQTYSNLQQMLYQPIQQWTQQVPQIFQQAPAPRMQQQRGAVPLISSLTPSTITAGTFSVLTINGNGFGTLTGQAAIAFSNANDGGATFNTVASSQIVGWSNTQIRVQVPTDAGTGPIRITDAAGAQTISSATVSIPYSILNLDVNGNLYRTYLKDINNSGGLTLQYNANFQNYPNATAAFERALTTWRCGSFLNFDISSIPANAACQNQDGISIVNWDTACALPSGVLGQTRSNFSFCASPITVYLDDVDLIFTKQPISNFSWNFGQGNSTNQQYDFESVALHELGHAHQLTHVIEPNEIMHFSIGPGSDKRVLSQEDINGGSDVIAFSAANTCGPVSHVPLTANNCSLGGPSALFTGVPQQGCAPHEVFFFDQSSGNPTSWQWDINNDGSIDYTGKNISHTYTQPGIYDVKLIVMNASGADTLVQTNYIEVAPTLVANAGADTILCEGGTVQLNGSATGGDSDYSISWSPSAGLNSTQIFNPVASPTATTTYVIEVTDGLGCQDTDTVTVTLVPAPAANAGQDDEVCLGQSIMIGGSPAASGGTGTYTYSWRPEGLGIPDSANPLVTPKTSTTYTLEVVDALGCSSLDEIDITVLPLPTADAGADFTICQGTSSTLGGSPSASGGAGGFTYLWLPNQLISSTAVSNPTFSAQDPGVFIYTLQIFDSKGCSDADTVRATVLPEVIAEAGGTSPICAGETIVIGGSPAGQGGNGKLIYAWLPGSGINDVTLPNPTASPTSTTTYTLSVTDQNGCEGLDSITVEVFASPTADAGPDKGLCDGLTSSTVIGGNPSGSGGTGSLSYMWSPTVGLTNPTIANPTAAPGQPATYILTVSDANGCEDKDTMSISINPPLVARAGTRDSVCQDACLTLGQTPTAVGGDGNFSYNWSPTNGLNDPMAANPEACPTVTTTYTLDVVDGKGCTSQDTIVVVVKPAPAAEFGALDTSYCESDPVVNLSGTPANGNYTGTGVTANTFDPGAAGLGEHTLFYTVVNAEGCSGIDSATTTVYADPVTPTIFVQNDTLFTQLGFAGYQWLFNGISIANANKYFLYRPAGQLPGVYEVIVTNENDCSSRSAEFTYTSTLPIWQEATIQLYPNPATTQAQLIVQLPQAEQVNVLVYDLQGRVVAQLAAGQVLQQQWLLPTSSWAAGMYLIRVQGESGEARLPLIVE